MTGLFVLRITGVYPFREVKNKMKIVFDVEIENTNVPEQCGCITEDDVAHLADGSKWQLDNSAIVMLKMGRDINGERVKAKITHLTITLNGETEPCSVIDETEGENGTDY